MRIHIVLIFLFSLIHKITSGQTIPNCNIPIHLTVDSLNNFLMRDYLKRVGQTTIPIRSVEFREKFDYEKSKTKNFDSIYWCCENYLIKKLGKDIYFKYVDMQRGCCSIETKTINGFMIRYGLQLPNLLSKVRYGWVDYIYERISVDFKVVIQEDSTLQIIYPSNVPDCKGLPDCGFIVTKEKAIETLKKSGVLSDKISYSIEPDGINWVVMFKDEESEKTVKINLQTGVQSAVQKSFTQ